MTSLPGSQASDPSCKCACTAWFPNAVQRAIGDPTQKAAEKMPCRERGGTGSRALSSAERLCILLLWWCFILGILRLTPTSAARVVSTWGHSCDHEALVSNVFGPLIPELLAKPSCPAGVQQRHKLLQLGTELLLPQRRVLGDRDCCGGMANPAYLCTLEGGHASPVCTSV